jgi:alpha-galactosidase
MKAALLSVVVAIIPVWGGCSSSSGPDPSKGGSGGGQAKGGTSGSGGAVTSSGGSAATGGMISTGGNATGGKTGGSSGTTATGGSTSTGGAASGGATGGGTGGGAAGKGGTGSRDAGATGGSGGTTSSGGSATGGGTGTATGGTGGSTIVGATPPMGWNSWNKFACDGLNETVVKGMADAFITSGMKDVGYEYVNLDDCWMDGRDSSGKIQWDKAKFPAGIPALADYVHSKGLKLGLYSTPNNLTCTGLYGQKPNRVGSLGHETSDAQSYASWGVDYLKYDKCTGPLSGFATMHDAIKAAGRPIFISINPGDQGPYCTVSLKCSIDLPSVSNMWRIEFDISANWNSVVHLIDMNKPEYVGAGPGHWNDPDMLEVGNGLNDTEGRAHFSMWAIMAAPLITGNDLTQMSDTTKSILTNKEIIAVNQDPLGYQGRVVATPGTNLEVWSKNLTGTNTRAVALFNRGTANASITVKWSDIGLPAGSATVRDLWAAKDLGASTDSYTGSNIPGHTVMMLKIVSAP